MIQVGISRFVRNFRDFLNIFETTWRESTHNLFKVARVVKLKSAFMEWVFCNLVILIFFSIWVFFREHSWFTGQEGKGGGYLFYLTPLYHFHPLHRHLDINRVIAIESSPLCIASNRTRTGNLWFLSASR